MPESSVEVVPRKGDVDRNTVTGENSLSVLVVPRKGDVDRNVDLSQTDQYKGMSSPARGTWIEMDVIGAGIAGACVVPRKGDVDRNSVFRGPNSDQYRGRPPQGGRG